MNNSMRWVLPLVGLLAVGLETPAVGASVDDLTSTTEQLVFRSGHFEVGADLTRPTTATECPAVILVHGDGPVDRRGGGFYLPLIERFLRAGYAVLSWDKPGTGESTGRFSEGRLFKERASILADAIKVLRKHPFIDDSHIGVWGISQGGYVIAKAFAMTDELSFVILVGAPGADSVLQTAYLVRRQLEAEGHSTEETGAAERHYRRAAQASTYSSYWECSEALRKIPLLAELGLLDEPKSEGEWRPQSPDSESCFNPAKVFERVRVPVLLFFGAKDTQVDPAQGMNAYRSALLTAGNQHFQIEFLEGADHFGILCDKGTLKEQRSRTRSDWTRFKPEYLDAMETWLGGLRHSAQKGE
jgi:dipeptidyl aminopeptidase/acylaminoacyl peptidase